MTRRVLIHLSNVVLLATTNLATAVAATLGLTAEPTLAHLPSYVAHEKGLFRSEGLSVKMTPLTGRALISTGVKGTVDFVPIEGCGAQAVRSGSRLKSIDGQSVMSHSVLAVRKNHQNVRRPSNTRQNRRDPTLSVGNYLGSKYLSLQKAIQRYKVYSCHSPRDAYNPSRQTGCDLRHHEIFQNCGSHRGEPHLEGREKSIHAGHSPHLSSVSYSVTGSN
jgi:hypothetical protein